MSFITWIWLYTTIKFSPRGSVIEVATAKVGNTLRVLVKDEGVGVSKEDAGRLFQKFVQSADGKKAGGSGLGLAISKLIVTSHGGSVGVDRPIGKGSIFWFSLPTETPGT